MKPTPMPTLLPVKEKLYDDFFLGQEWTGFSYLVFLHSKRSTGSITLSQSCGRKGSDSKW